MKYQANPVVVDAFKITKVMDGSQDHPMILQLENGKLVSPNAGMTARMIPAVGDYWVIQSDGYIYLNPKDVFERKYRPLNEEESGTIDAQGNFSGDPAVKETLESLSALRRE